MFKRKCAWDSTHVFEVESEDQFRPLCPNCFHNIYGDLFKNLMTFTEFYADIENIKIAFKYVAKLDAYYKNNILKLAASKPDDKEVEMTCLICDAPYSVTKDNTFRCLCPSCTTKYYFLLKQNRNLKQIKELILNLKKVYTDTDQLVEKLLEIINNPNHN